MSPTQLGALVCLILFIFSLNVKFWISILESKLFEEILKVVGAIIKLSFIICLIILLFLTTLGVIG